MKPPLKIPQVDDTPAVRDLVVRLGELRNEDRAIGERVVELCGPGAARNEASDHRQAQVEALLAGAPIPDSRDTSRAAVVADLERRRALVRDAIRTAEGRLAALRAERAQEIAVEVLPQFRASVEALASNLVTAATAEAEVRAMQAALEEAGVGYAGIIWPMVFPSIRLEEGSKLAVWLEEASRHYNVTVPEWEQARAEARRREEEARAEEAKRRRALEEQARRARQARTEKARAAKATRRAAA